MNPTVGMLATVRNRRGIVSEVQPYDGGQEGRLHLVTIEYADADGAKEDRLIWEREVKAGLVQPAALPRVSDEPPMPHEDYDALVRATRWSALSPFLDPVDPSRHLEEPPLVSPFHGAIEADDYQLVPVLKALRMPRVSLLLADDVGLGKTIEAGLVLKELLLSRRIRRVLIICPASLRSQWQAEMKEKFSLDFDPVDRETTNSLRRRMGMDANPWRAHPRIVASYYYLRQPDVLEEFLAFCRSSGDDARLPWDLLIVDEAHNLSPAPFGEDSDLSLMLGDIAPYFEHRLFLTATPHNGHTRSFTGLLERLDPMRFSQSSELKGAMRSRVEDVLVRRLKREINEVTDPPRFAEREIDPITLELTSGEQALSRAFSEFRSSVRQLIAERRREEQLAGAFAVEILGKRLLSCPVAFADSWHRYQEGAREDEAAQAREVQAAERATREELDDDLEVEGRTAHANRVVGAWLRPFASELKAETAAIDSALEKLGLSAAPEEQALTPIADSRLEALLDLVDKRLRSDGKWRDDERLVVFTEYKTTLDYLQRRLEDHYPDAEEGRVLTLFGGMAQDERDAIKAAFNRAEHPVRILLATDAAAEGLNLQETARYLLHYDIPWNPSRLEQRNGRLDRHGQARDVRVFHFASEEDDDLRFLARVVGKVETIREDLGSVGEVIDAGLRRRLIEGAPADDTWGELDRNVDKRRGQTEIPCDRTISTGACDTATKGASIQPEAAFLEQLRTELDLDAKSLRDTLEAALAIGVGRPRFSEPDERGRLRLEQPVPAAWQPLVDDALRLAGAGKAQGVLPGLVFDPNHFIQHINGRPVFRPEPDTALLHLGHPLYHRALNAFARRRFPTGGADQATRWTVRHGGVPDGAQALVLLTVEELAINELREDFHHWVRTWQLPVHDGELADPLSHQPAVDLRVSEQSQPDESDIALAQRLWDEVSPDLKEFLESKAKSLDRIVSQSLNQAGEKALESERERFRSRQAEIAALMGELSLAKLRREIEDKEQELRQLDLLDQAKRTDRLLREKNELQEELKRRQTHLSELSEQLKRERQRMIEHLLPRRYTLMDRVQCFPVAVEIRLPEADA